MGTREASSYEYWPHAMTHTVKSIVWNDVFEAFEAKLMAWLPSRVETDGLVRLCVDRHEKEQHEVIWHPEPAELVCDHLVFLGESLKSNDIRLVPQSFDVRYYRQIGDRFPHCPECGTKLDKEG